MDSLAFKCFEKFPVFLKKLDKKTEQYNPKQNDKVFAATLLETLLYERVMIQGPGLEFESCPCHLMCVSLLNRCFSPGIIFPRS